MRESKIVKTCDRCGYTVEHNRGIIDYIPVERDGYHTIITDKKLFKTEGIYLCNTCYMQYLHVLKKFMDESIPNQDSK